MDEGAMTQHTPRPGVSILLAAVFMATLGPGRAAAQSDSRPAVKVHVVGEQTAGPDAAGVADSVADLQNAVAVKFAKTLRLVPARGEADITVEVMGRERHTFARDLDVRVHDRSGTPARLFNSSTQGGFADVAEGTMRWIERWSQSRYAGVVGHDLAALREVPVDIYVAIEKLRINDPTIRANAAEQLRLNGARARAAAPALIELLGDRREVLGQPLSGSKSTAKATRERVGAVAGRALVGIGQDDDLFAALASDRRSNARASAAEALGTVRQTDRSVAALRAAAQNDTSDAVRRAAAASLAKLTGSGR
jgi:hypothetical protein